LAGESQAHLKYKFYAEQAKKENLPNIARLFEAASLSERFHATNYLKVLDGEGKTTDNLGRAQEGETFEVEDMYPAYVAVAKEQGENEAAMFFKPPWLRRKFMPVFIAGRRLRLNREKMLNCLMFMSVRFAVSPWKVKLPSAARFVVPLKISLSNFEKLRLAPAEGYQKLFC